MKRCLFKYMILLLVLVFAIPSSSYAITEIDIYKYANKLKAEGWKSGSTYKMDKFLRVCSPTGRCHSLGAVGKAYTRKGGKYADYYGSSIMTKLLMEKILSRQIVFNSGDRPQSIGSNRHHTKGGSYAFDLSVSSHPDEKAKVAAAWKFAAQTLGYSASVGMRYGKSSGMVHVDTVGRFGSRQWGTSYASVNGRLVLRYYGRKQNTRMPCTVLAKVLGGIGGKRVVCDGGQSLLVASSEAQSNQVYRSNEAQKYAQGYQVDVNASQYAGDYYKRVVYEPEINAPYDASSSIDFIEYIYYVSDDYYPYDKSFNPTLSEKDSTIIEVTYTSPIPATEEGEVKKSWSWVRTFIQRGRDI